MSFGRSLKPEDRISRYRILRLLGVGGMGEVYCAHDEALGREVALKILPPHLVLSEDRVRRFTLEATSTSSLSHPHIIHIYEIGQAQLPGVEQTLKYIAMEFVKGQTLSEKIHREKADLKRLLGWLAQAADGLAKAHGAGVVHRDLKPSNIMISDDGYAKVLDFGVAKLIGPTANVSEAHVFTPEEPTLPISNTQPGMLVGTVGYMAPEQVQGKAVDHRVDIFAFGCILYEATTRQRAFTGNSSVEVMHKILHDNPIPVEELAPLAPTNLCRLIRRCTVKEIENRLDSMKALALELRELVGDYDVEPATVRRRPGPEVARKSPGRLRIPRSVVAGTVLLVVASIGFLLFHGGGNRATSFESMKMSTLVSGQLLSAVAISPDGRYIALISIQGGKCNLWVKQILTGSEVRVVGPTEKALSSVAFSPDGNYVYYVARDSQQVAYSNLLRVPTLGGASSKLIHDIDSRPAFASDGRITFTRGEAEKTHLVLANADGTGERILATKEFPVWFRPSAGTGWSPDGTRIMVCEGETREPLDSRLVEYSIAEGKERGIGPRWAGISSLVWRSDGSSILLSAKEDLLPEYQLWSVSYPSGVAHRITNDLGFYQTVTATADGKSLCALQRKQRANLWAIPISELGKLLQLLPSAAIEDGAYSPHAAAEHTVGFMSYQGDTRVLVEISDDGRSRKQITPSDFNVVPEQLCRARNTGEWFFRAAQGDSPPRLWKLGFDERTPTEISADGYLADASPEGEEILLLDGTILSSYRLRDATRSKLCEGAYRPVRYSPNGKRILVPSMKRRGSVLEYAVQILDRETGAIVQEIPLPEGAFDFVSGTEFRWAPSGDALTFVRYGAAESNLWSIPLDGHEPYPITHFTGNQLTDFEWSQDGEAIYLVGGDLITDAVLIRDFE